MKNKNTINSTTKPLNEMSLQERMEYQKTHDRAIILNAAMKGASVELKTLAGKRSHPLAPENMQNN